MDNQLRTELINLLSEYTPLKDRVARDAWLLKLPSNVRDLITQRYEPCRYDLQFIISAVEPHRLENEWVILSLIDDILQSLKGLAKCQELQALREKIEKNLIEIYPSAEPQNPIRIKSEETPKTPDKISPLTPPPCPATLEELIQTDREWTGFFRRDELLREMKRHFAQRHFIVLFGQPMVGKTKLLYRLAEELEKQYVPLIVTGQGLELNNTLDDFDNFAFDLADQLTIKFRKWAKRRGLKG